jgi:hypothetical protein
MVRFEIPRTGNLVVIAPREGESPTREELIRRGGRLDGVFRDLGFSLEEIARNRID